MLKNWGYIREKNRVDDRQFNECKGFEPKIPFKIIFVTLELELKECPKKVSFYCLA